MRKRNGWRDKKSKAGPEPYSLGLGRSSHVPPVLPVPILLQRACFWGCVQHSPNYPDQVMEGFVHVERWVLGTGFYVWNLEGKAQLGKSSTEIHKALFPKTANSQRSRGTPCSQRPPQNPSANNLKPLVASYSLRVENVIDSFLNSLLFSHQRDL